MWIQITASFDYSDEWWRKKHMEIVSFIDSLKCEKDVQVLLRDTPPINKEQKLTAPHKDIKPLLDIEELIDQLPPAPEEWGASGETAVAIYEYGIEECYNFIVRQQHHS